MTWMRTRLIAAAAFLAVAAPGPALATDLSWNALSTGGSTSEGGGYAMTGAIGQPESGVLSGGPYTLTGGFWAAFEAVPDTFHPADVNRDGEINALDVQLAINGALGRDLPPNTFADINQDDVINAVDVQLVINAALGIEISV